MKQENVRPVRQSARVSISIPVILSGADADGNTFRESVRTLIVNRHGGKVATSRHLKHGAEVSVENPVTGLVAKAKVAWWSQHHFEEDLHHVGLQLLEPQNIWGMEFPPDDWSGEAVGTSAPPVGTPQSPIHSTVPESTPSPPDETAASLPQQECPTSVEALAREFEQTLRRITQQVGSEFEISVRDQAARREERERLACLEEIKALQEQLNSARAEIVNLEISIQQLRDHFQATEAASSSSLAEAHRQLASLSNSILASMNRAAETGLTEYRKLLQQTNQETATRRPKITEPKT